MSASTQPISAKRAATLQRVDSLPVVVRRPAEVADYIERHADLADLLPLACLSARSEFGNEAELSLEVYRDPEIADEYLTLYVRQAVYDRQVMVRIERVRARYRDKLSDRSGWLHVTTDFRSPGARNGI
jgi:hypothetical protein